MFIPKRIKRLIPNNFRKKVLIPYSIALRMKKYGFRYRGITRGAKFLYDGSNPTFFGYHDKTPFSADGSKILAMSIEADDRKPESECTPMKLGYFKKTEVGAFENIFIPFAETTTWCFQQGCMLQWHPRHPNTRVVFNRLVGGQYGSVVFDIEKNETIREFNFPIYSLDPLGRYAVTLNFSRLGRLRPGYGYGLLHDQTEGVAAPEGDGLSLLELQTGEAKLLISFARLASENGNPEDEHYVNHASFSPDGKSLVFFHIWLTKEKKRKIRFCCYDLQTDTYRVIESIKTVSHFCWMNDSQILATTKLPAETMKLCVYNVLNGESMEIWELPHSDTHPMQSPVHKNIFILDSYPDRLRDQHLFLFDIEKPEIKKIASFFSPLKYTGQVRCDLHPRWDREGKYVVVDSARDGRRKMFVVNLPQFD